MGALVEQIQRSSAEESSRQASLLAEASAWFERIRQFREIETELLVLRDPSPTEQRLHRACLAQLVAQGESLAVRSMLHGLPENSRGIKMDTIDAELHSLLLKQSQWYSAMSETRKKELFQEVFGGAKSAA